jgi:hypothetical protein
MKLFGLLCCLMVCSCSADGEYTGSPIYVVDAGSDANEVKEEMPPPLETSMQGLIDASDQ